MWLLPIHRVRSLLVVGNHLPAGCEKRKPALHDILREAPMMHPITLPALGEFPVASRREKSVHAGNVSRGARALHAHRAPVPEEEPLPGEEPAPEDDPTPHPDPVVREPDDAPPLQMGGGISCDAFVARRQARHPRGASHPIRRSRASCCGTSKVVNESNATADAGQTGEAGTATRFR